VSLEAWGDEGDIGPEGYVTDERAAEMVAEETAELVAALQQAVQVIKQWYNMGGGEDVWQIYYENAPEMKLIRETLTRSTDRRP
jgi:hypothetical protein